MINLPGTLVQPVWDMLTGMGDPTEIQSVQSVGGGCINNATRLETKQNTYFLKWNSAALPGMFASEADGLQRIRATHTVRVPTVYGHAEKQGAIPAFILLEWLEPGPVSDQAILGEQLAAMHRASFAAQNPPKYGLDQDNYIGSSHQINRWEDNWIDFFANCRLRPQMETAQRQGRLRTEQRKKLESLMVKIPTLLEVTSRQPSLIHGDLWNGNVIGASDGLALIDPAVSYSDREAEIAFTELFGGFNRRFYDAYQAVWPLDHGYAQRRDIYNLYHLLNHLNLFGESYEPSVNAILNRYA